MTLGQTLQRIERALRILVKPNLLHLSIVEIDVHILRRNGVHTSHNGILGGVINRLRVRQHLHLRDFITVKISHHILARYLIVTRYGIDLLRDKGIANQLSHIHTVVDGIKANEIGCNLVFLVPNDRRIIHRNDAVVEIIYQTVAHCLYVVAITLDVRIRPHEPKFGGVGLGKNSVGARRNGVGVEIQSVALGAVSHQRPVSQETMLWYFIIASLVGGEGYVLRSVHNLHIGTSDAIFFFTEIINSVARQPVFLTYKVAALGELTLFLVVIVPAALRVEVIVITDDLGRAKESGHVGLDIVSKRVGIHLVIRIFEHDILVVNQLVALRVKISEFGNQRVLAGVCSAAVEVVGDILIHIVIDIFSHHTHRILGHHHIVAHTGEAGLAVIIERIAPQMHRISLIYKAIGVNVTKCAESIFGRIVESRIAKHRRAIVVKLHVAPQHLDVRAIYFIDLQGVGIDNFYLVNLLIVLRRGGKHRRNGN